MPPSYNPDEAVWIQRARAGEQAAFGNLVEAYQGPVYNLCFRMLGDPAAAEDAAQETFIKAFRNMSRYDVNRRFVNWLLSIASHYCIDQLRRRRPTFVKIDEAELPDGGLIGPEQNLVEAESHDRLRGLMADLDPTDRAALVLHYWHEQSMEEIGRTLKLSQSAVKSRLHRARRALAAGWSDGNRVLVEGMA
jgi:RNA polymerase sigma-70 factor (ECF subfamily)